MSGPIQEGGGWDLPKLSVSALEKMEEEFQSGASVSPQFMKEVTNELQKRQPGRKKAA